MPVHATIFLCWLQNYHLLVQDGWGGLGESRFFLGLFPCSCLFISFPSSEPTELSSGAPLEPASTQQFATKDRFLWTNSCGCFHIKSLCESDSFIWFAHMSAGTATPRIHPMPPRMITWLNHWHVAFPVYGGHRNDSKHHVPAAEVRKGLF